MKYLSFFLIFIILTLANPAAAQTLQLTEEEQLWLDQHPLIHIAYDKSFPPFEWKNSEGDYQGISIDYIEAIEKQLNIKFQQVQQKNWSKILKEFQAGKIDVISAIAKNDKRNRYMLFTAPHISVKGVIVSAKLYKNIKDLEGERVGVVNNDYWDDLISQYDDELEIIRVENTQAGIELAAIGAIDAMVSDLASVTYVIHKDGISNLQFVPTPIFKEQNLELSIGIRRDWPLLQSILQKAINNIDKEDKDSFYDKWIKVQKVSFWQDKRLQYKVAIISLTIILAFAAIIFWNRSLKLQVARRSEQLETAHTQLIHAEKMESIGRLSAGVAHEVKNPLAILQMSIDYLKGEDNDETINSILDDMDDAVVRADTVIKGLLDFSREKELQVTQGSINEVIEKSLKLIEHELKQRNIQLKTSLSADLPDIGMDRNRLQQVFINLLMNSAQAIGNLGEINVSSSLMTLNDPLLLEKGEGNFSLGQKVILIDILDTGSGLKKKDEKNVFEPFFTTKPLGEGTGLGLSVSKTIIGLHNGMIIMRNRIDGAKQGVEVKILFAIAVVN